MTYFVEQVPGAAHCRYVCGGLDERGAFHVSHTQVSRPDGTEIKRPAVVIPRGPTPPRVLTAEASRMRDANRFSLSRKRVQR